MLRIKALNSILKPSFITFLETSLSELFDLGVITVCLENKSEYSDELYGFYNAGSKS